MLEWVGGLVQRREAPTHSINHLDAEARRSRRGSRRKDYFWSRQGFRPQPPGTGIGWPAPSNTRLGARAGPAASRVYSTGWRRSAWPWCSTPPRAGPAAPGSSRKRNRRPWPSLKPSCRPQRRSAIRRRRPELTAESAIRPCSHPGFPKLPLEPPGVRCITLQLARPGPNVTGLRHPGSNRDTSQD